VKRKVFLFLLLACFGWNIFAEANDIWGIWNTESIETSWVGKTGDGFFLMSGVYGFLIFESGYTGSNGGRSSIAEQGLNYEIKEIILNEGGIVSLYVETPVSWFPNYSHEPITHAKFVMHFIDQDRMWLEVDRSDELYPTDPEFGGPYWFEGPSVIFWRERVVMDEDGESEENATAGDKHDENSENVEDATGDDKAGVDTIDAGNAYSESISVDNGNIAANSRKSLVLLIFLLLMPLAIFGYLMLKRKQG